MGFTLAQPSPGTNSPDFYAWHETLRKWVNATNPLGVSILDSQFAGGADPTGAADSSAAIQAAINAVNAAGGGIVWIPPGTYLCGELNLLSNIIIAGTGWGSVVKMTGAAQWLMSVNSGSQGSSDPTANKTNIGVRDIQLLANTADTFNQNRHLLNVNACSDLTVTGVLFKGFKGDGLYLGSSNSGATERHNERVKVLGCTFDGVGQDNRNCISVVDCTDLVVSGCQFMNSTRTDMPGAIDIEPNPGNTFARIRNIIIVGNTFRNIRAGIAGVISLVTQNAQVDLTTPQSGLVIADNTIIDCAASNATFFLQIPETPTLTSRRSNIVISGNTVYNSGRPFEITGVRGVNISDNLFDVGWGAAFVGFNNDCLEIQVSGNTFEKIGTTDGVAISIARATRMAVNDNIFVNNGLANGTDGRVMNFTIGSGSVGASDKIDFMRNQIEGTTHTTLSAKNASHTITAAANNRAVHNRLNGLTVNAAHFNGAEQL